MVRSEERKVGGGRQSETMRELHGFGKVFEFCIKCNRNLLGGIKQEIIYFILFLFLKIE